MTLLDLIYFVGGVCIGIILVLVWHTLFWRRSVRQYQAQLDARTLAFRQWMDGEEKALELRLTAQLVRHRAIMDEIRAGKGGRAPNED